MTTVEPLTREITFLEGVSEAQAEEMRRDPHVFLMGEDVQTKLFGTAGDNFVAEFGTDRIRNTPISEAGFVGAAAGAAMVGMRPIVDLTMACFTYVAMDQIVNIIAKSRYLYGGQTAMPLVLRSALIYNAGLAAQHSDRPYPMFMHVPGLVVIAPSNASDAKGLLKSAIVSDDPVLCFEDGSLWASRAQVPVASDHYLPLGSCEVKRPGTDVTVVAVAGAVQHALAAAAEVAPEGIEVEVIDPRTLAPLDRDTIVQSVAKTGRLVAVDPSNRTCGAAAEILASVVEAAFWDLKSPPIRLTVPDVHIPFSPALERGMYPSRAGVVEAVRQAVS